MAGNDDRFLVLDVVRMGAGVALLAMLVSWWWPLEPTKYTSPWFWRDQVFPVSLSPEQLAWHDGRSSGRVYVCVSGALYDVTAGRPVYGPGGAYHTLAGRDAARAYGNGCLDQAEQRVSDTRGLADGELATVAAWQAWFARHRRYWRAGSCPSPPPAGPEPPACANHHYHGSGVARRG